MSTATFDFTGENFAVTGASSGLGRLTVERLAASGGAVLAIARRADKLASLVAEFPGRVTSAAVDVCDKQAMSKAVTAFVAEHGKFSGSVHAAGLSAITPIRSFDSAQARQIMDISFWAGVDFLQMISKKKNSLDEASHVLFSSVYSVYSAKGMFAYNAAKAAVVSVVRTAAKELAPRQRVNAIMPGWVKSEMTDELRKISNMDSILANELLGEGEPSDVVGTVLFLLSNEARWVTGTAIAVDGGFLA